MHAKRHVNLFLVAALISALALNATAPALVHAATILRVTETGLTSGTCGADWMTDACGLQNALSQAVSGDEIWVAAGTYTPTTSTDRTATFQLKTGVALYGGFAGTETLRSERDWATNVTVLSGDLGTLGDVADNSYHVVTGSGVDATAVLDGFTITGGNANGGNYPHSYGGGMYNPGGSPTLTNVTFTANSATHYGGGMYRENSSGQVLTNIVFSGNSAGYSGGGIYTRGISNSTLTNVTFSDNSAGYRGGGMTNYFTGTGTSPTLTNVIFSGNLAQQGGGMANDSQSSPTLTNVTFSGNSAESGGGMHNYYLSNPTLTNITFSGNSATSNGGGMGNDAGCEPTLTNVTFSGNSATSYGGGMYSCGVPTLVNSILWGNAAGSGGAQIYEKEGGPPVSVTYSDIQGGWSGTGNIDADPLFIDADGVDDVPGTSDDNLRLRIGSPAIDMGSNEAVPVSVTTDLDGNPRIRGGVVDMGAYENQYQRWYVNDDGTTGSSCLSWSDACSNLQTALDQAVSGDEIWVAAGMYTPGASGDRMATFQLKNGVAIYGGFAGIETLRSERDWVTNVTTLSGDIGTLDEVTDNSYHVVTGSGADATAVLDGFTVTGGNADGSTPHDSGGGMTTSAGSPTLTNVTFSANSAQQGGGMYNSDASSPTLINVLFNGNWAAQGGGMHNANASNLVLTNVVFSDNSAGSGGGVFNNDSNPTLTNLTFSGNAASQNGGAMYNNASAPTLANSILWGNTADAGGAQIYNISSTPCIVSSNIQDALDASNVWEANLGTDGGGNRDADPLFLNNLRLAANSPAINAGSNDRLPADTADLDGDGNRTETNPFDLDGAPRIVHGAVDMGAYEWHPPFVTVSRSGNNVLLTFAIVSTDISYQVWRSPNPYFTPVNEGTNLEAICTDDGITVTCTHENAIGDPDVNSFYVVRASYTNGAYEDSNRIGVFGFALVTED